MIDTAQEKQIRLNSKSWMQNKNLSWKVADAAQTDLESSGFDAATCAFGIRNIPDRIAALNETNRLLKPRGKLSILEFSLPANPLLRWPYRFYLSRVMPTLGKCVIGSKEPLDYLARSVSHWDTEVNFSTELAAAGFRLVHKTPLSGGVATLWVAVKN